MGEFIFVNIEDVSAEPNFELDEFCIQLVYYHRVFNFHSNFRSHDCSRVAQILLFHRYQNLLNSGSGFDTQSGNIPSFLLLLFQEGQLSVTGESMCTKYWLTA